MKKTNKVLAVPLVALMTFALSGMTAFAGTITVTDVVKGETYEAFKILEYKSNADKSAYSYYLEESNAKTAALKTLLEGAGFTFTESADKTLYYPKLFSAVWIQVIGLSPPPPVLSAPLPPMTMRH